MRLSIENKGQEFHAYNKDSVMVASIYVLESGTVALIFRLGHFNFDEIHYSSTDEALAALTHHWFNPDEKSPKWAYHLKNDVLWTDPCPKCGDPDVISVNLSASCAHCHHSWKFTHSDH